MKLSRNCNGKEKYTLCKVYNNHRVHGNRIILLSQPNLNRNVGGFSINHEVETTLHFNMGFVTSINIYECYRRDRKRLTLFGFSDIDDSTLDTLVYLVGKLECLENPTMKGNNDKEVKYRIEIQFSE